MITKGQIKNFKTLKDLSFPCTRMNLFIGDTSTGRSNILEALTLFSRGTTKRNMFDQHLIRYEKPEDLFSLRDLSEPVMVDIGALKADLSYDHGGFTLKISARKGASTKAQQVAETRMDTRGLLQDTMRFQFDTQVRRYEYLPDVLFGPNTMKELEPPYGANLPGLLAANKVLRGQVSRILEQSGLRLEVNAADNTIRLNRSTDENVVVTLPYRNMSDTVKRYLFMYAILGTVKGCTLLFDEPEQNMFPFYTKHLAEMMAMDATNQYFVTTHNAYLFRLVVEKTVSEDLSVWITHNNADGETQLKRLQPQELGTLLDMDVFFNLDRFTKA